MLIRQKCLTNINVFLVFPNVISVCLFCISLNNCVNCLLFTQTLETHATVYYWVIYFSHVVLHVFPSTPWNIYQVWRVLKQWFGCLYLFYESDFLFSVHLILRRIWGFNWKWVSSNNLWLNWTQLLRLQLHFWIPFLAFLAPFPVMFHVPGWGRQRLINLAPLESNIPRTTFTAGINSLALLLRGHVYHQRMFDDAGNLAKMKILCNLTVVSITWVRSDLFLETLCCNAVFVYK